MLLDFALTRLPFTSSVSRMRDRAVFLCLWALLTTFLGVSASAYAALPIPLSITLSEVVNVTGVPRLSVDVGGNTRYATYTSGSGTNTLTFTLTPSAGDVDLDGIAVASPIDLNGGTIKDLSGNNAVLTFTPPNTTGIKVNYPSLVMDFVADADGRYSVDGTVYNDLSSFLSATGGSFTRASTATYFDSSGTLQTAATNAIRFDYDPATLLPRGILIEGYRINRIRNSTGMGAVAGTPGTMPTNWTKQNSAGLSFDVVGTGVENGLSYVDFRVYGTPSASASIAIFFEGAGIVPAVQGEVWAHSFYAKLVGGSLTNITSGTISGTMQYFNSSSSYLGGLATSNLTPTSAPLSSQRASHFGTLANASTASIRSGIYWNVTSGLPVDMTLRVAAPQLEKSGGASSYIPTSGAEASRSTDLLTLPLSSWFSASQGTLWATTVHGSRSVGGMMALEDSASPSNNRMSFVRVSATSIEAMVNDNGTVGFQRGMTGGGNYTSNNMVMGYALNNFRSAVNGTLAALDVSGTLPVVNRFLIGAYATSYYDAWISKIKYYPVRLPDATLASLTQ